MHKQVRVEVEFIGNKASISSVGEYGDDPLATFHLARTLAGETGINITLVDK